MSAVDDIGPDGGGDDIVAAEYVLGVLPADERRQAALAHRRRAGFRAPCRSLGGLFLAARRRLLPRSRRRPASRSRSTAGCSAAVPLQAGRRPLHRACCRASPSGAASPWRPLPRSRSISRCPSSTLRPSKRRRRGWSPRLPPTAATSAISRSTTNAPTISACLAWPASPAQGSDFELWVIEGQQAPVSLGVIPAGASARLPVSDALRAKMVSGACSRSASSRTAVRRPARRPVRSSLPAI